MCHLLIIRSNSEGDINVENLHYSYDNAEVLTGLNYHFEKGKKYLITGKSGSGKSTLLQIIAGIYPEYIGKIKIGSEELKNISRKSLTRDMTYMTQEPSIFNDTILNNVTLYEDYSEEAVKEALNKAGLADLINELPEGINTVIGKDGTNLSGGQKQRIALARSFVRNSKIILLDESTSHLDPATAAGIEDTVLSLNGVTVLLVSHNATETLRSGADKVLVMEGGTLVSA